MERVCDIQEKMEQYFPTGQTTQGAVVPMEEEEEGRSGEGGGGGGHTMQAFGNMGCMNTLL